MHRIYLCLPETQRHLAQMTVPLPPDYNDSHTKLRNLVKNITIIGVKNRKLSFPRVGIA